MNDRTWVVFDCEANGLTPDKFYCVSYRDNKGKSGTLIDYDEMIEFFKRYDVYIGHNIRRWDLPNLSRVVSIAIDPYKVVDTLFVAWYLEPDEFRHSIELYGERYGVPKPVIIDWDTQTLDDYIYRCEQDVEINYRLWKDQFDHLMAIYEDEDEIWRFLGYLDFKAECAALQEESQWKFDDGRCQDVLGRLEREYDEKFEALTRAMPSVPIIRKVRKPKVYRRSNGELSVLGRVWQDRLNERGLPEGYDGIIEEVTGYNQGNPNSDQQVKAWLYSLGWQPDVIKYLRDKDTGEVREIPQVNKERGEGISESVKRLYEKCPELDLLDGLGVISHRIGILRGFLRDSEDGYLTARVAGLTNTLRFKHAELVNLPKPEKPWGKDIRGCLIADEDEVLCGADMSSLEDKLKQHYIYPYDPKYVRELQTDDYDPHLDIAGISGLMTWDEVQAYKDGDHSKKHIRTTAKNTNYCCQYGGMPKRVAITAGVDLKTATTLYEAYWKKNWAIRACAGDQIVKTVRHQKWLFNPISNFWYSLRQEKDRFSTLVQGSAVYCFDLWLRNTIEQRRQLTAQFHDEGVWRLPEDRQSDMTNILINAINETNEDLQLNVQLGIDIQFGKNYADIH